MNKSVLIPVYYVDHIDNFAKQLAPCTSHSCVEPAIHIRIPSALEEQSGCNSDSAGMICVREAYMDVDKNFIIPIFGGPLPDNKLPGIEEWTMAISENPPVTKTFTVASFSVKSIINSEPDIMAATILEPLICSANARHHQLLNFLQPYHTEIESQAEGSGMPIFVFTPERNCCCSEKNGYSIELDIINGSVELTIKVPVACKQPKEMFPFRCITSVDATYKAEKDKSMISTSGVTAIRCNVPSPMQLRPLLAMGLSRARNLSGK
jgi:hypothetical protein